MTAEEVVQMAYQQGVRLVLVDDTFDALPEDRITPLLDKRLREHKAAIVAWLQRGNTRVDVVTRSAADDKPNEIADAWRRRLP